MQNEELSIEKGAVSISHIWTGKESYNVEKEFNTPAHTILKNQACKLGRPCSQHQSG
jgi:hypothetical protein